MKRDSNCCRRGAQDTWGVFYEAFKGPRSKIDARTGLRRDKAMTGHLQATTGIVLLAVQGAAAVASGTARHNGEDHPASAVFFALFVASKAAWMLVLRPYAAQ
eukprot:4410810-Pyramimonas_sp.AAC.1